MYLLVITSTLQRRKLRPWVTWFRFHGQLAAQGPGPPAASLPQRSAPGKWEANMRRAVVPNRSLFGACRSGSGVPSTALAMWALLPRGTRHRPRLGTTGSWLLSGRRTSTGVGEMEGGMEGEAGAAEG